jgi:hypothetical protein
MVPTALIMNSLDKGFESIPVELHRLVLGYVGPDT